MKPPRALCYVTVARAAGARREQGAVMTTCSIDMDGRLVLSDPWRDDLAVPADVVTDLYGDVTHLHGRNVVAS